MITRLSHAGVWVLDQDAAKDFYREKLGFEVRNDVSMDGFRWLTVGAKEQPDVEIILSNPDMLDAEAAAQIRAMVARGALGAGVMATNDCRATHAELASKGVIFQQEPTERPYGIEAVFRDDSGTWFSLTQRHA